MAGRKLKIDVKVGELNVKNRTLFTSDNLPVLRGINSNTIDLIYLVRHLIPTRIMLVRLR